MCGSIFPALDLREFEFSRPGQVQHRVRQVSRRRRNASYFYTLMPGRICRHQAAATATTAAATTTAKATATFKLQLRARRVNIVSGFAVCSMVRERQLMAGEGIGRGWPQKTKTLLRRI